jgi:lysophospholipase L1-like esterase
VLGALRLYQAMRYGLSALRPPGQRVAVPVADARENLVDIATLVTARGGRVVLASEGLAPDPGPLAGYNAMMRSLADGLSGVSYVDVAERLHAWEGDRVFLDDCHLTETGHRLVADALVAELRRLGVVEGAHAKP